MQVRVLFFGILKDVVGLAEDKVELTNGADLRELFARYRERFPRLKEFENALAVAVNQEYAEFSRPLQQGDEVAFLPPVSGGAEEDFYELVRTRIVADEIVRRVKAPEDGAVVVFDGIVRNNSRGKPTLYLEYEAYEPMALRKMREIGDDLRRQFPIHRIAIVHRLGRLEIGETSVLIAISSPHRKAAFDACRLAIDRLKQTVPIWKKEYFADGAVWVEGETLPASLATARTKG